jgi:hypothetical protein
VEQTHLDQVGEVLKTTILGKVRCDVIENFAHLIFRQACLSVHLHRRTGVVAKHLRSKSHRERLSVDSPVHTVSTGLRFQERAQRANLRVINVKEVPDFQVADRWRKIAVILTEQQSKRVIACSQQLRSGTLASEFRRCSMRGGPIELERMGSTAAPLAVHCLYAGRHIQRRGRD